ncbi:MAG TPA: hypothetical protein VJA84_03950 [Candidatus Omnitrophota bacterium]|nr:hypothetical protein [Candidatus Omnitrophota bacterium]
MLKRGQSVIEYSVLVGVIAAAFIAMSQYVNRAIGARLKQVQEEIYVSPEPGVSIPKK